MNAPVTTREGVQVGGQVQPLSEEHRRILGELIPATPIFQLITRRDELLANVRGRQEDVARARPPGGLPEAGTAEAEQLQQLEPEVASLEAEVERLDTLIQAGLEALHIQSDDELVDLVTEQFPRVFEERARDVAISELEHNREIVTSEAERYGISPSRDEVDVEQNRQELREAAEDLLARDRRIEALQAEGTAVRREETAQAPTMAGTSRRSTGVMIQVAQLRHERDRLRDAYSIRFPILHRVEPEAIAESTDRELSATVSNQVDEILQNIDDTRVNIRSGDLSIWNLPSVVDRTRQELRVGDHPVLAAAIENHVQEERRTDAMVQMGVAALAITAGIVASLATGGLALAAGGVALGTSVYQLSESVESYVTEVAAENVALDPRVADISREEPELHWVILDLVSVGLDAAQVVRAFGALRRAARAVREAGAIEEFAGAARSAAPEAAERLIASATREAGVSGALVRTIEAVGDAFRQADMELIIAELEAHAEHGFATVVGQMHAMRRIHPLTEAGLEILGPERAARLITGQGVLRYAGLYDDVTGNIFIRPGRSIEEFAGTVVHEVTHHLQRGYGFELRGFRAEFQALAMERDYIHGIERAAGLDAINALPEHYRNLAHMTDDQIADLILTHPDYRALGYISPASIDYAEAVTEALETIREFY